MSNTGAKKSGRMVRNAKGQWVSSTQFEDAIKVDLSTLTKEDKMSLIRHITQQPGRISVAASAMATKWTGRSAVILEILQAEGLTANSAKAPEVKFALDVVQKSFGTVTSITGMIDGLYAYATKSEDRTPDFDRAAINLVTSFFSPSETGTSLASFAKSKEVANYYPKSNPMADYKQDVAVCTTVEQLETTMSQAVKSYPKEAKVQMLKDMVSAAPEKVMKASPPRVVTHKAVGTVMVRGKPIKWNVSNVPFEKVIHGIERLSGALGTKKHGFGRISECHYDGVSDLRGSHREKYEYLTDYIPIKTSVICVNTSDPEFACAIYRQQKHVYPDVKCAVVYNAGTSDVTKFNQVFRCEKGIPSEVINDGVIGYNDINWYVLREKMQVYYVSFKPPEKGKGSGVEFLTTSHAVRQHQHEIATKFANHFYYAHVASLGDGDKAYSSCRGRLGVVIITDAAECVERHTCASVCLQMAGHAVLYPWFDSCYMYTVDGQYFYPGVRALKSEYDMTRMTKKDTAVIDFADETADTENIDAFRDLVYEPQKEEVVSTASSEAEEREETEDDDLFKDMND
jgi:hypothetical protein